MKKLKDIADITSGIFVKPNPNGKVVCLQAKCFNTNGEIIQEKVFPDIMPNTNILKHILKDGDIVFSSKGLVNFAAIYKKELGPAVASSTFSVIRMKCDTVIPEFLKWYLNHPKTLAKVKAQAMGTSVQVVTIGQLKELEIKIPPLRTQYKIIEIDKLRKRANEIEDRLRKLNQKIIDEILISKI